MAKGIEGYSCVFLFCQELQDLLGEQAGVLQTILYEERSHVYELNELKAYLQDWLAQEEQVPMTKNARVGTIALNKAVPIIAHMIIGPFPGTSPIV